MQLTLIGLCQILIGFYLLFARRIGAMLAFTLICSLMGGAASISVTALGNTSIGPGQLSLAFLGARLVLARNIVRFLLTALRQNAAIIVFAIYAAFAAYLLPRIFHNALDVIPMRPPSLKDMDDLFPLGPTPQNATTAIYMAGTAICAVLICIAVRQVGGATRFAKTAVFVAFAHAIIGILSAVGRGTFIAVVLNFFRNGNYAQVEQSAGGYARINGIMPEASAYAGYGIFWFVLMVELWLRDVLPRRTGPTAIILVLVLLASTSSTAYVGIGFYGVFLVGRTLLLPSSFRGSKIAGLIGFGTVAATSAAALVLFNQDLATQLSTLLHHFTVDKLNGSSGKERTTWALQGFDAFRASYGLGIGPGSFRSSSLVTSIVGSVGVIGTASFLLYCTTALKPFDRSTYGRPVDLVDAVGIAASWAAVLGLVPLAMTNPSSDPGLTFGILGGAAVGLRLINRWRPTIAPRHEAGLAGSKVLALSHDPTMPIPASP